MAKSKPNKKWYETEERRNSKKSYNNKRELKRLDHALKTKDLDMLLTTFNEN